MSAKPANRLYDGTTIHEDSHDGAARDYLEALGEPSVEVSIDGRVKKYYGREAIFRAMIDARNGIYLDAPVLALGGSRSPELFMARMAPFDIQFTGDRCELWCSLSWDGENVGNVCIEHSFTLDSLFEARVIDTYEGHYRITGYANVECGTAHLNGGGTCVSHLPDGSYVLVEKVSDRVF